MVSPEAFNLDDVNQTAFYIPYTPDDGSDDSPLVPLPETPSPGRDILNGRALRLIEYHRAWTKCLDRMQTILRDLTSPLADIVVQEVRSSRADIFPGLPFPELPVISLTNPAFGSTFLIDVTRQLDTFVTHLYPSDCTNIVSGMKSLVSGFIEHEETPARVKHKPTTSLANHDIGLLVAWYEMIEALKGNEPRIQSDLVVVLHDFEQFDPIVMQDIFYICSQHVGRLPLVFLLSMSSPMPSYLHVAYPRSTLARLRIKNIIVPSGVQVLNEIITMTFFSTDFHPDVMIGPATLQFLSDFYTRHIASVDALLTIIQLMHLKHFTIEPLTILVLSTPSAEILSQPENFAFLEALVARSRPLSSGNLQDSDGIEWSSHTPSTLIDAVDSYRSLFRERATALRIAFHVLRLTQAFLVKEGYKGLGWELDTGLCDILTDILQNNLNKDLKDLGLIIRKLKVGQLKSLLIEHRSLLASVQLQERSDVAEPLAQIDAISEALETYSDNASQGGQLATDISDWIVKYIASLMSSLESLPLWDLWYTGLTPFPSELLNPSVRASILAGLLRPHDFENPSQSSLTDDSGDSLWELPDTSILFKRYLDSGRMINVYDWFESFQAVLERQRTQLKAINTTTVSQKKMRSPRKQSAKARGKQRQDAVVADEQNANEDSEEKWKIEVQARFIRAMHELDYLGFIKHTKRRVDHVVRTAFEITD